MQQIQELSAALSAHGEDKDDRFLPKMIWFGFAPVVAQALTGALAIADKTPLPSLADSILWFVSRQPDGREEAVLL